MCDRRAQCTDKSDEFNCTLVLRPEGYQVGDGAVVSGGYQVKRLLLFTGNLIYMVYSLLVFDFAYIYCFSLGREITYL